MPRIFNYLTRAIALICLVLPFDAIGEGRSNSTASRLKQPRSSVSNESLAMTLYGPCASFSYHNVDDYRATIFTADPYEVAVLPSQYDLQRESNVSSCLSPGLNLGIGEILGQHIEQNTADPYVFVSYRIRVGQWNFQAEAGLIYNRHNNHPVPMATTINFAGLFPFVGVNAQVKF